MPGGRVLTSTRWVGIVDGSELYSRALAALVAGEDIAEKVSAFPGLDFATRKIEDGGSGGMLILDLCVPDCDGAETLHELRHRFPHLRILVGVPTGSRHAVFGCLLNGAHGCFVRTQPYAEIVAAVRAVATGEIYVPPSVCDVEENSFPALVADQLAAPQAAAIGDPPHQPGSARTRIILSSRQSAVLDLILKGFSNKAIARELALAEGTVKVHVNCIFRVLNVHSRLQAVTRVMETSELLGTGRGVPDIAGFAGPTSTAPIRVSSSPKH